MYKKVLCTAAALALTVGAFGGCAKKPDQAALDGLNTQVEQVVHNYNALVDVLDQYGSVQQQEEFADAKAQLDEITSKVSAGDLTADDVTQFTADLASLMTTITSIGDAASGNIPEEQPVDEADNEYADVDAQTASDRLETVATLISGVLENAMTAGNETQQLTLTDLQVEVAKAGEDLSAEAVSPADVMEFADFVEGFTKTIDDELAAAPAEEERNVNDELESLATLISGVDANISTGDDQFKKDYIAAIRDALTGYTEKAANGELTEEETADILDAVDVLSDLVKGLNE